MAKSGMIEMELSAAASQLGISERTLRRRIEQGELGGRKIARKWYIFLPVHMPGSASSESVAIAETMATTQQGDIVEQSLTNAASKDILGSPRVERRWARGYQGYEAKSDDPVDQAFAVGRLAAWRKLRELQGILRAGSVEIATHTVVSDAAALLLDGFLSFGSHKIDCYRQCRSLLCKLVVRLAASTESKELMNAANAALGAVHALVVTLNRRSSKHRKEGRPVQDAEATHSWI